MSFLAILLAMATFFSYDCKDNLNNAIAETKQVSEVQTEIPEELIGEWKLTDKYRPFRVERDGSVFESDGLVFSITDSEIIGLYDNMQKVSVYSIEQSGFGNIIASERMIYDKFDCFEWDEKVNYVLLEYESGSMESFIYANGKVYLVGYGFHCYRMERLN